MQLDAVNNILYLAIGSHTNMGAPSNNFAFLPEYALSAAILSIDLDAIGETTYDLPTLDDEDHPGADPNDPFGGNDGKNQAMLVPGGPVQVHAPGFRNPYDLIITSAGHMFTIVNGPNADWGDVPIGEGPDGNATNAINEPGVTYDDGLHLITGAGYYGGHPNPTRSNPANTFNSSDPQSPVSVPNAIESDFLIPGVENGALHVYGNSTNGLAEYTAGNFGGALQGDLLAASFANAIQRIELNAAGDAVVSTETLFSNVGVVPLDVTTPVGQFDGTIWVADIGMNAIHVFEPTDGGGGTPSDLDGDGYSNDDENANGTDPLNAADVPPDNDVDFLSDLLDDDDDNDLILDPTDAFAIDENNGTTTPVGTLYTWENNAPPAGGFFDLGLTGLMTNGVTNYLDQFDDTELTAGGAAGVLTIDAASSGTALGAANTQEQAFQFGVDVGNETFPYAAHTRLVGPFTGQTPTAGKEMGFFIGTGDQDNYVKLVVTGENGGSITVVKEEAGVVVDDVTTTLGVAIPGPSIVDLWLSIDPVTNMLQASYSIDQGVRVDVGPAILVPVAWTVATLAVGLIAVDPTDSGTMPVTWDFLGIEQEPVPPSDAEAYVKIDFPSTFGTGSFTITNNSPGNTAITSYTIDLSTSFMPDVVFDPSGLAGDPVGKDFTPDVGETAVGLVSHSFLDAHDGGFDKLQITFDDFDPGETFRFSVDIDPTSIQGAAPPGPEDSGSISGFELTGATADIEFDDGNTFSGEVFRQPLDEFTAEAIIKLGAPVAPAIDVLGLPPAPTLVSDPAQTVQITGTLGESVRVLVVEGALHLMGVPNGGFDIDPFEINKALSIVEHTAIIGAGGTVDVPILLTDSHAEGGISYIFAVTVNAGGQTSNLSNVAIVELDASAGSLDITPSTTSIDFGSVEIGQSPQQIVTLTHAGVIGSGDVTIDTSLAALVPAIGPFSFVFSQAGIVTLAPGESVDVTVSFDPMAEQTDAASLDIPHSGDNSPVAISLSGTGVMAGSPMYRVNAGGAVVTGNPDWSVDSGSSPSPFSNAVTASSFITLNTATIDMSDPAIPAGTPVELFSSERWDSEGGGEMQWSFPVDPGDYEVRLYFAETFMYAQTVGARLFDVAIEGATLLDDFDIFAAAGGNTAWVETFTVTSDDMLNIDFAHVVQNPIINAIEILPAPGNLTLKQLPVIKGDFDNNGVVNGRDYLVWLTSGGSPTGDGNGDGNIDQHDVDAWYSEAAAVAVPLIPEGDGYWEHPPSGSLVAAGSLSAALSADNLSAGNQAAVPVESIGWRTVEGSLDVTIPEMAILANPTPMTFSGPTAGTAQAPRIAEKTVRDQAVEDLFELFEDDEELAESTNESLDAALTLNW
ncbi:MAG: malectin domain-containing carbohydrate-binding protein [Aeoliella sp.]